VSTLKAEAVAAWEAERAELRAKATTALKAILVRKDGTQLNLSDLGLEPVHTDLDAGLVVWSDGATAVAATLHAPSQAWSVRAVRQQDGQWTTHGQPVTSLAELGAILSRA